MSKPHEAKEKNKGGRPSKYTPELLEKATHYVENYKEYGDAVPTIVALCLEIDVAYSTAFEWSRDPNKPEFSNIYLRLESFQHRALVNGGLAGGFNSAVTKMMMTKHGYSDRQEVEHSGGVTVEITRFADTDT